MKVIGCLQRRGDLAGIGPDGSDGCAVAFGIAIDCLVGGDHANRRCDGKVRQLGQRGNAVRSPKGGVPQLGLRLALHCTVVPRGVDIALAKSCFGDDSKIIDWAVNRIGRNDPAFFFVGAGIEAGRQVGVIIAQ